MQKKLRQYYMIRSFEASLPYTFTRIEVGNRSRTLFDSLLSAGLSVDFLHEHRFCAWDPFPDMEQDEDGFWRFKDPQKRKMIPLMFSLKATKPMT